jgi:hypothetical protein
MELPGSNIKTESSGVFSSKSFGIGDPGVILNILRTKIYKDPIMAIAREVTCNARDAHREVGHAGRAIEIQFPNQWEKNLCIQDFGPGISPQRMEEVFVNFGSSTKRSDNVQTGGFGLGAKTPFAYSDSFTVITVVDGLKYTYTAYIDETQVGKMDMLGAPVNTDERNGTSICIAISKNDKQTFVDYIMASTKHWKVKPLLKGLDPAPAYPKIETIYSGTDWVLPDRASVSNSDRYGYRTTRSAALVDGIEYPLDADALVNATRLQKSVLETGFFLSFDVGELSLSASRDNLHYCDKTQAKILDKIDVLIKEIVALVTEKISGASNYTEACKEFGKVKRTLNRSGLMDDINGITWKDNEIRESIYSANIGKWCKVVTYSWDSHDEKLRSSRRNTDIGFMEERTKLLKHDTKSKHVPGYAIAHILEGPYDSVQVISVHTPPNDKDYWDQKIRAETQSKDLEDSKKDLTDDEYKHKKKYLPKVPTVEYDMKLFGLLEIGSLQAIVDSIPKEQKKRSVTRRKKEEGHILGYILNYSSKSIQHTSTSFEASKGGLYIKVDYKSNECYSGTKLLSPTVYSRMRSYLGSPEVVGFSPTRVEKLGPQWKPLHEAVDAKIAEDLQAMSVDTMNEAAKNSHHLFRWSSNGINILSQDKFLALIEDRESPLVKWVERSAHFAKIVEDATPLRNILDSYNKDDLKLTTARERNYGYREHQGCELDLLHKEAIKRYPLLMQISVHQDEGALNLVNYINLFDSQRVATPVALQPTGT